MPPTAYGTTWSISSRNRDSQRRPLPVDAAARDAAPGGAVAVTQFTHRVVEQAGEAAAQIEAAGVDLPHVVQDENLQRLLVPGEREGLRQEHPIRERGDRRRTKYWGRFRCIIHAVSIALV